MATMVMKDDSKHSQQSMPWIMRSQDQISDDPTIIDGNELQGDYANSTNYSSQISFDQSTQYSSDNNYRPKRFGSATPYNSPLSSDNELICQSNRRTMTPQTYYNLIENNLTSTTYGSHRKQHQQQIARHYEKQQRLSSNPSGCHSTPQTPTKFCSPQYKSQNRRVSLETNISIRRVSDTSNTSLPCRYHQSKKYVGTVHRSEKNMKSNMISKNIDKKSPSPTHSKCLKFVCCCDGICFEALCPSLIRQSTCGVILAGGAVISAVVLSMGIIYLTMS